MPPKKVQEPERKPLIGRVGTNLRVGIVGIPNVGKSTFFNVLTKSSAAAENFPFCTIDPNENNMSTMTNEQEYDYKRNIVFTIKPDQTVVLKKRLLPYASRARKWKKESDFLSRKPSAIFQDYDEWYPFVNSYYPFTEDVDAFARVHHLLETKHSTYSLEKEPLPEFKIEYDGERAFHQYLRTNPICFLILGKPGLGEEEVGKRLADYWKCIYIDPLTLLQEEIASGSRPGQCIEFNLRCGRAIGIDVLMRLLAKKVQSPEVQYRGFVCCGFPLVPNDLYEEDPISSESAVFNVREIFDEIIDQTIHLTEVSDKVVVSMVGSSKGSIDKASEIEVSDMLNESAIKMSLDWSLENQICGPAEISTDLEKQIACIFGLFREPFMIIYIYGKNSDVVLKRDNYYFDIFSKKNLDMQKIILFNEVGASNEELVEDLFDGGRNPFVENPDLKYLVKLPDNLPANVNTQLDRYYNQIAVGLDCRILQHEHQYYIKLDGRAFISQMLHLIKLRLKVLPLQRLVIPEGLRIVYDEVGEGLHFKEFEQTTTEEAFLTLCKKNIPSPEFKWRWSEWSSFCPVSMFQGIYQQGDPKLPVRLGDKIYFLADERKYSKFIEDPRTYVLPPFPKPGSNILIFGPPVSGKSAIANCLGYLLNSKVLTPSQMYKTYFDQLVEEYKEQLKQIAIAEAMEILKEQFVTKTEEKNEKIAAWETEVKGYLNDLKIVLEASAKKAEISSFPLMMETDVDSRSLDEEEVIRQKLHNLNIPQKLNEEYCDKLLEDSTFLLGHLPSELDAAIAPPSVLDPFVLEYANTKVEGVSLDEIKSELKDNAYEMYTRSMRSVTDTQHDGCIIDGMTTDVNLLQQICEEFHIHDAIILKASDYNFLLERFKDGNKHIMKFRDYRNFFFKIKEIDAAWRSPSVRSTDSYKKEMAGDILSEILTATCDEEAVANEQIYSLQKYAEAVELYKNEIEEVEACVQKINLNMISIEIDNLSVEDLLHEVITLLKDKYRRRAYEITDEDRAEEMQEFLAQAALGVEGENVPQDAEEYLAANRRYGDTLYYCPVAFSNKFVLWRGKENYAVRFKDRVYLCATEKNMKNFIKFPRKFLRETDPPERFPPPRICVVGLNEDITTVISKRLAHNLGVRYFNFKKLKKTAITSWSSTTLYIEDVDENLPDTLVFRWYDVLFSKLWLEEPSRYIGFVFDGFPKDVKSLNYMIFQEAIPDVIISLNMNREENLKRNLKTALDNWRANKEEQRKEEEELNVIIRSEWEENRKQRYNELMELRRQKRFSKLSEGNIQELGQTEDESEDKGLKSETQISFNSVIEQQDHDEVMKILEEELPEPMFQQSEDPEEVVIEHLTEEIDNRYIKQLEILEEIKKICDAELIPFLEIDANQDIENVTRHAYIVGNDLKFRGPSFFERCYDVSLNIAENLITSGYFLLSLFGRLCPVQYYDKFNTVHCLIANEALGNVFPVIHRRYIYFLSGKANRERFFKNPLKYTNQSNINFPLIPLVVAVIGPPKCGKSSIAQRFKRDLGFRVVSRGQAIRHTLSNPLNTNLITRLEALLRKGEELTDELVMDCVNVASHCGESVTQALIFDGFPNTESEVRILSRLGLVPHLIFDLQISEKSVYKQSANSSNKYPQYSERFISHLYKEWNKTQSQFREWSNREYQNIYKLNVDRSIWGVWEHARDVTFSVMFERKHYYMHVKLDWPLRLANMLVTPLEFLERQSGYKTFCPGCLYYERKLFNGGEPPDRTGLVQYGKFFYWLCEKHIEDFLKFPEKFLPPNNIGLPLDLPKILNLTQEPKNPVEDGFCLSCYQSNFPMKVLNRGNYTNAVLYKEKIFLFDKVDCMNNFMATPEKLCNLHIHFKQQDVHAHLGYQELPVLGMLEQYVARAVCQALTHTNMYRPIIPGLSIKQSALICVGLNLKANNSKTAFRNRYAEALELFHEKRQNLIQYLDTMKKYLNPFVHYEEPDFQLSSEEEEEGEFEYEENEAKEVEVLYEDEVKEKDEIKEEDEYKEEDESEVKGEDEYKEGDEIRGESEVKEDEVKTEDQMKLEEDIKVKLGTNVKEMEIEGTGDNNDETRRVPVPDERFDYLCEYFKPVSKVPAFLNVVDIAGLVKGASEGQGLGNAFLSHISACDAIFHLCRAFEDDDVTHVEGDINPVRDLEIIAEELRLKDEDTLMKNMEKLERTVLRGGDKKLKPEYDTLVKIKGVLVDEKKHIRFGDWDAKDIEVLNKYLFLTSKPTIYLVNLAEKDYIKKKNKWLIKIKEWVDKNDPGALIIPFSGAFEHKLVEEYSDPDLRKKYLEELNTTSALDKIIVQGYKALQLEYFFTAGPDEVKAWTIQKGTKAPQAAGRIHTDFEKGFIMAEVMKFTDFKEEGSEAACKAAGKYRQQGRNYVVEDGDIIFFKFNAGAGLKDAKKK